MLLFFYTQYVGGYFLYLTWPLCFLLDQSTCWFDTSMASLVVLAASQPTFGHQALQYTTDYFRGAILATSSAHKLIK